MKIDYRDLRHSVFAVRFVLYIAAAAITPGMSVSGAGAEKELQKGAAVRHPVKNLSEAEKAFNRALEFELLGCEGSSGKWFRRAGELGSVSARCIYLSSTLANPSERGTVTQAECAEAYRLAEKSKGTPEGAFAMGLCLSGGVGVERNPESAAEYFNMAAASNCTEFLAVSAVVKSQFEKLGRVSLMPFQTNGNVNVYQKAYEAGSPVAAALWAGFKENSPGASSGDRFKALYWASDSGSMLANVYLACAHLGAAFVNDSQDGSEFRVDVVSARESVYAAIAQGLPRADADVIFARIKSIEEKLKEE